MDPRPDTPGDEHISGDMPCISCGYNLRTLAVSGPCPECGQPVLSTAHHALVYANVAWLETLRDGAAALAWTPVVLAGIAVVIGFLLLVVAVTGSEGSVVAACILTVLTLLGGYVTHCAGVTILTGREHETLPRQWSAASRWARICLFGPLIAVLLSPVAGLLPGLSGVVAVVLLAATLGFLCVMLTAIVIKGLVTRCGELGIGRLASATVWLAGIGLGLVLGLFAATLLAAVLLPPFSTVETWLSVMAGWSALIGVLAVVIMQTVLMFRVRGVLDRTITIAEGIKGAGPHVTAEGGSKCSDTAPS